MKESTLNKELTDQKTQHEEDLLAINASMVEEHQVIVIEVIK